jgi:hypothetical protein
MCATCGCGKKPAKKTAKKAPAKKMAGKQSKLDMNKNGKLDGADFAMLRKKKK